jgi:hypothetical protein
LQSQNWTLQRLWTPQYFRDPQGCIEAIVQAGREMAEIEAERDGLRVAASGDPTIERP